MREGRKYKLVRGMASVAASFDRSTHEDSAVSLIDYVPEGVEAFVSFKGSGSELITQLARWFEIGHELLRCNQDRTLPRKRNIRKDLTLRTQRELST